MASKPETVFRKRVREDLKTLERTAIFPIQQKTIEGDPDFILCVFGQFVALELKSKLGKTSRLQDYKLDQVRKANGWSFVAYPVNWKDIFSTLQQFSKGIFFQ